MNSQIILDGFLGKNAQSKMTQNNKLMARFQMSVKVFAKEAPAWVPVIAFEKTAEIARDLTTGQRVVVWGELDHFTVDNRQILSVTARKIIVVPKAEPKPETTPEADNGGWG